MTTPVSERPLGKRCLTSPLDEQERKRCVQDSDHGIGDGELGSCALGSSSRQPGDEGSVGGEANAPITLRREDLGVIAELLKDSFRKDLSESLSAIVRPVVDGVLSGLQQRMAAMEEESRLLREENRNLRMRLDVLEGRLDDQEQYSRRSCLRVSGLQETDGESTDDLVLQLAASVGVQLTKADVDRSHRVGRKAGGPRPRAVIVKFTSYRARQSFYRARTKLKGSGHATVYVNEDLTRYRGDLLYRARQMVKRGTLSGAWSSDGNVLVKDSRGKILRIVTDGDLTSLC